jgi:MSHA pilin protein MshA
MFKQAISMHKSAAGFTLIELVVVITILGLLASFAMPRFAALQTEARIAKMEAALGSIKAAAALAHSVQLTQQVGPNVAVVMEGSSVNMINGYPTSAPAAIGHAAGLADGAGVAEEGYVVAASGAVFTVTPDTSRTACAVRYTQAAAVGSSPTYDRTGLTTANCQ